MKMILRTFAETGVRNLMLRIRKLLMEMNELPVQSPADRDVNVKVGIGIAEKSEKLVKNERVLALMEKIIAAQGGVNDQGLVNLGNIYSMLMDYLADMGIENRELYITNPQNIQPPMPEEQPIDAAIELEKAKLIADTNAQAAKLELEMKKHNDDVRLELLKIQVEQKDKLRSLEIEIEKLRKQAQKAVEEDDDMEDMEEKNGTPAQS